MKNTKTQNMIITALMAVIMAISSWITIPFPVPFTLQTMAVFLTLKLLGGKRGTISILVYILMALIGIPVLSGFKGGAGALFGPTGGYIFGFLIIGIIYWIVKPFTKSLIAQNILLFAGLLVCYGLGTVWFITVSDQDYSKSSLLQALTLCVFPYIIPDIIKLIFADYLAKKIKKTNIGGPL